MINNINKELYNAAKRHKAGRSTNNNKIRLQKAFENNVNKQGGEHFNGHKSNPGEFNGFMRTLLARGERIFGENSKPVNKKGFFSRMFGR